MLLTAISVLLISSEFVLIYALSFNHLPNFSGKRLQHVYKHGLEIASQTPKHQSGKHFRRFISNLKSPFNVDLSHIDGTPLEHIPDDRVSSWKVDTLANSRELLRNREISRRRLKSHDISNHKGTPTLFRTNVSELSHDSIRRKERRKRFGPFTRVDHAFTKGLRQTTFEPSNSSSTSHKMKFSKFHHQNKHMTVKYIFLKTTKLSKAKNLKNNKLNPKIIYPTSPRGEKKWFFGGTNKNFHVSTMSTVASNIFSSTVGMPSEAVTLEPVAFKETSEPQSIILGTSIKRLKLNKSYYTTHEINKHSNSISTQMDMEATTKEFSECPDTPVFYDSFSMTTPVILKSKSESPMPELVPYSDTEISNPHSNYEEPFVPAKMDAKTTTESENVMDLERYFNTTAKFGVELIKVKHVSIGNLKRRPTSTSACDSIIRELGFDQKTQLPSTVALERKPMVFTAKRVRCSPITTDLNKLHTNTNSLRLSTDRYIIHKTDPAPINFFTGRLNLSKGKMSTLIALDALDSVTTQAPSTEATTKIIKTTFKPSKRSKLSTKSNCPSRKAKLSTERLKLEPKRNTSKTVAQSRSMKKPKKIFTQCLKQKDISKECLSNLYDGKMQCLKTQHDLKLQKKVRVYHQTNDMDSIVIPFECLQNSEAFPNALPVISLKCSKSPNITISRKQNKIEVIDIPAECLRIQNNQEPSLYAVPKSATGFKSSISNRLGKMGQMLVGLLQEPIKVLKIINNDVNQAKISKGIDYADERFDKGKVLEIIKPNLPPKIMPWNKNLLTLAQKFQEKHFPEPADYDKLIDQRNSQNVSVKLDKTDLKKEGDTATFNLYAPSNTDGVTIKGESIYEVRLDVPVNPLDDKEDDMKNQAESKIVPVSENIEAKNQELTTGTALNTQGDSAAVSEHLEHSEESNTSSGESSRTTLDQVTDEQVDPAEHDDFTYRDSTQQSESTTSCSDTLSHLGGDVLKVSLNSDVGLDSNNRINSEIGEINIATQREIPCDDIEMDYQDVDTFITTERYAAHGSTLDEHQERDMTKHCCSNNENLPETCPLHHWTTNENMKELVLGVLTTQTIDGTELNTNSSECTMTFEESATKHEMTERSSLTTEDEPCDILIEAEANNCTTKEDLYKSDEIITDDEKTWHTKKPRKVCRVVGATKVCAQDAAEKTMTRIRHIEGKAKDGYSATKSWFSGKFTKTTIIPLKGPLNANFKDVKPAQGHDEPRVNGKVHDFDEIAPTFSVCMADEEERTTPMYVKCATDAFKAETNVPICWKEWNTVKPVTLSKESPFFVLSTPKRAPPKGEETKFKGKKVSKNNKPKGQRYKDYLIKEIISKLEDSTELDSETEDPTTEACEPKCVVRCSNCMAKEKSNPDSVLDDIASILENSKQERKHIECELRDLHADESKSNQIHEPFCGHKQNGREQLINDLVEVLDEVIRRVKERSDDRKPFENWKQSALSGTNKKNMLKNESSHLNTEPTNKTETKNITQSMSPTPHTSVNSTGKTDNTIAPTNSTTTSTLEKAIRSKRVLEMLSSLHVSAPIDNRCQNLRKTAWRSPHEHCSKQSTVMKKRRSKDFNRDPCVGVHQRE